MTEPKIDLTIVDHFDPEVTAMLQAYYSRSHERIKDRLAKLGTDNTTVKEALKKYLINYGHKSIGQCGDTTMFIEGVSILAAKVFEDTTLFNGQETSTRFINFADQPMHDPLFKPEILQKWIDFYVEAQEPTIQHIAEQQGLDLTNQKQYDAAKARAFDVLRAFVPAGASTQLSWHSNFTHLSDRIIQLAHHPLEEVRLVSKAMAAYLQKRYPYACADLDKKIEQFAEYYSTNNRGLNYLIADDQELDIWPSFKAQTFTATHLRTLDGLTRPKGTPVARHLQYQGRLQFKYKLDYGSFRDIQRHRPCVQMMPILTTRYGFHNWYLDSLPESLRHRALLLIASQTEAINKLYQDYYDTDVQYYIPLGFVVPGLLDADYPQAVYISEIRTSKFVHPTLRKLAQKIAHVTSQYKFGDMYIDMDTEDFTIKRGQQTIKQVDEKVQTDTQ